MELDFLPTEIERVEAYRVSRKVSLLAIAFSDIVGYTDLCERLPEHEMGPVRHGFEAVTSEHVERRRQGLIVKRIGDAVLAVYSEPTSAVLGTLELHAELDGRPIAGHPLRLRSGVHLGQVALERTSVHVDVFGRHVNRAARVQAAAEPGQVLVTEPVADNVHGWLEAGERAVRFFARRTCVLKGIDEPVTVFAAEFGERADATPPAASLPRVHAVLRVRSGRGSDQTLVFDGERDRRIILGRDRNCDVPLVTPAASRKHAMISFNNEGRWVVNDLGSANGIFIAGARVDSRTLTVGDEIRIGDCAITIASLGPASPSA